MLEIGKENFDLTGLLPAAAKTLAGSVGDSISDPDVASIYLGQMGMLESLFMKLSSLYSDGEISEEEFFDRWNKRVRLYQALLNAVATKNKAAEGDLGPNTLLSLSEAMYAAMAGVSRVPDEIVSRLRYELDNHATPQSLDEAKRLAMQAAIAVFNGSRPDADAMLEVFFSNEWSRFVAAATTKYGDPTPAIEKIDEEKLNRLIESTKSKLGESSDAYNRSTAMAEFIQQFRGLANEALEQADIKEREPSSLSDLTDDQLADMLISAYTSLYKPWRTIWGAVAPNSSPAWAVALDSALAALWTLGSVPLIMRGLGTAALGKATALAVKGSDRVSYLIAPRWTVLKVGKKTMLWPSSVPPQELIHNASGYLTNAIATGLGAIGVTALGAFAGLTGVGAAAAGVMMAMSALMKLAPVWEAAFRHKTADDISRAVKKYLKKVKPKIKSGRITSWNELLGDAMQSLFPAINMDIQYCADRVAKSASFVTSTHPLQWYSPELDTPGDGSIVMNRDLINSILERYRNYLEKNRETMELSLLSKDYRFWGTIPEEKERDIARQLVSQWIAKKLSQLQAELESKAGSRTTASDVVSFMDELENPLSLYSANGIIKEIVDSQMKKSVYLDTFMFLHPEKMDQPWKDELAKRMHEMWKDVVRSVLTQTNVDWDIQAELLQGADHIVVPLVEEESGFVGGVTGAPTLDNPHEITGQLVDEFVSWLSKQNIGYGIEVWQLDALMHQWLSDKLKLPIEQLAKQMQEMKEKNNEP